MKRCMQDEKEQENLQLTDNISTKIQAFSFTSNQEEITAELENDENHSSYANYIFSGKHEAEYDHVDLESSKDDQLTEEDNLTTLLINKNQEPEYNFGQGDVIYEDVDPESSKDDQLTEEDNLTTQLINKKQEPEHNSVQAVALFEDRVDPEASKDDQLTEEDNVTTPIINKKQESEYNSEQVDVVFEDLTLNVDPESSKDDQLTEEDNLTTPLLINKKLELEYNSEQVVYEDLTLHVDPETSEDVSSNSKDHFTKLFRDKIQETEHNSEQVVDYENRTTQIFYKNFSTTECLNTSNSSMKNGNLSANKKVYFKTEYGAEYQNSRTISSISKESVYSFQSAVCLKHFESNKMQVDEQKIESSDEEN